MSHDDRSPGAIGVPKRGASAENAGVAAQMIAAPIIITARDAKRSSVCIARLPFLVDPPGADGIVVILPAQSAVRHELSARRLHPSGIVGRAALQDGGTAAPLPRGAKARERFRKHRLLQRRRRPAAAAVGGHLDLADAALPRPGEAGDLVEAGTLQCEAWGGMGDDRLHLHRKYELP